MAVRSDDIMDLAQWEALTTREPPYGRLGERRDGPPGVGQLADPHSGLPDDDTVACGADDERAFGCESKAAGGIRRQIAGDVGICQPVNAGLGPHGRDIFPLVILHTVASKPPARGHPHIAIGWAHGNVKDALTERATQDIEVSPCRAVENRHAMIDVTNPETALLVEGEALNSVIAKKRGRCNGAITVRRRQRAALAFGLAACVLASELRPFVLVQSPQAAVFGATQRRPWGA